jgi:hypothetical protein
MLKIVRVAIALAVTVVATAAFVASASAGKFSTSNQALRATWREIVFTDPFGGSIRCPVTLEASLHARTFVKGTYNLIGHITRAFVGACSGGEATILMETLPWNIRYQSFEGRLPEITATNLLVAGSALRVHSGRRAYSRRGKRLKNTLPGGSAVKLAGLSRTLKWEAKY